jgi:hypothetical protein
MVHNVVYYDTGFNGIRQFSTAEIDTLAERVLRVMAAGTYTGSISIGTTNPIGTFVDTALVGSPGSTNITVTSNTYTLSQITTTTLGASANAPLYIGLDTTSIPNEVSLRQNMTTRENLADEILSRMVSGTGGTNAYYLATTAPADGGTWVSLGNLLDTTNNLTTVVTSYVLWKRTTSNATLTNRNPLEYENDYLREYTQAEVEALIKTVEERIIATGVGTYSLQQTVPGTGTWVNCGTVTDTRYNTTTQTFTAPTNYDGAAFLLPVDYITTYSIDAIYAGTAFTTLASYLNTYTLILSYDGSYLGNIYALDYQQSYFIDSYVFTPIYAGSVFNYTAPDVTYVGPPVQFQAPLGAGSYFNVVDYFGPPLFEGLTPYEGTIGTTYIGARTITSSYDTSYDTNLLYGGNYTLSYAAFIATLNYDTSYTTNLSYDGTYTGATPYDVTVVGTTSTTISNRTLWRRIA